MTVQKRGSTLNGSIVHIHTDAFVHGRKEGRKEGRKSSLQRTNGPPDPNPKTATTATTIAAGSAEKKDGSEVETGGAF